MLMVNECLLLTNMFTDYVDCDNSFEKLWQKGGVVVVVVVCSLSNLTINYVCRALFSLYDARCMCCSIDDVCSHVGAYGMSSSL